MQIPAVGRTWRQRRSASIEPPSFFATATRSSQNECSNAMLVFVVFCWFLLVFGAVRNLESRKVPRRKLRLRLKLCSSTTHGCTDPDQLHQRKHKTASSPTILIYPKFPTLLSFSPRFSSVEHPIYSHALHSEQLRISGFTEIWICNVPWHTLFSCHRNATAHPD